MSIESLTITMRASVRDALKAINSGAKGIALIVDDEGRLFDTLTDGDIRRAILNGCSTEDELGQVLKNKGDVHPTVGKEGATVDELLELMRSHGIRQVPIVDADGRPIALETIDALMGVGPTDVQAVIMAGGFGKRLYPLTEDTPKPMLPVGDKPLIEHIVSSLKHAGIQNVNITTHFMAEKIVDHFQDGSRFGVNVNYVNEDQPLGTAGALSLLEQSSTPLLVMNGDILTNVPYGALLQFHRKQKADLTVCVRQYEFQVPYGVIECAGEVVTSIVEKPTKTFFVNAGIYLLEPHVQAMIPSNKKFDMTQLIEHILGQGGRVAGFPIVEYWLDIGQHADYNKAQEAASSGELDPHRQSTGQAMT